jgi:hypothetical protein
MDTNELAAAESYFTNWSSDVLCVFCGVQLGLWEKCRYAYEEDWLWNISCWFIKRLFVGIIPICSNDQPETSSSHQQRNSSFYVYGCHKQQVQIRAVNVVSVY